MIGPNKDMLVFPTHVMVDDLSFENKNNLKKKSLSDSIK